MYNLTLHLKTLNPSALYLKKKPNKDFLLSAAHDFSKKHTTVAKRAFRMQHYFKLTTQPFVSPTREHKVIRLQLIGAQRSYGYAVAFLSFYNVYTELLWADICN